MRGSFVLSASAPDLAWRSPMLVAALRLLAWISLPSPTAEVRDCLSSLLQKGGLHFPMDFVAVLPTVSVVGACWSGRRLCRWWWVFLPLLPFTSWRLDDLSSISMRRSGETGRWLLHLQQSLTPLMKSEGGSWSASGGSELRQRCVVRSCCLRFGVVKLEKTLED
jgi:hypothetical protein